MSAPTKAQPLLLYLLHFILWQKLQYNAVTHIKTHPLIAGCGTKYKFFEYGGPF